MSKLPLWATGTHSPGDLQEKVWNSLRAGAPHPGARTCVRWLGGGMGDSCADRGPFTSGEKAL